VRVVSEITAQLEIQPYVRLLTHRGEEAHLRRMPLPRTSVNKAAPVAVYTGVGTFSELGKERLRLLGQSPSPEKVHYGG
jgi:hypothetical protein